MSNIPNEKNLIEISEFERSNLSKNYSISSLSVYKDVSTGEYYQWDGGYKKLKTIPYNKSNSNIDTTKYLVGRVQKGTFAPI